MRVLAVDYGTVRFGLAVSDALGLAAHALPTLEVRGLSPEEAAERVAAVAREQEAVRIVLGLPVNMSGTEGPNAARVRQFGALLEQRSALSVEYEDERLTTAEAEGLLRQSELSARKRAARVDALSAQLILRSWLDRRGARDEARE